MEKKAHPTIILPRAALPYVLLQRTGYAIPCKQFFARLERACPYLSVRLQSLLFSHTITQSYSADIASEFAMIMPHLPTHAETILDIGCGIGGLEVPLHERYPTAQLILLDRSETDPIHYGFTTRAAFYNSLDLAKKVLLTNGVPAAHITTCPATDTYDLPEGQFDLVISLLAWGFHFPLETYLDQVYSALCPGGVLIVDVRAGTHGEETLRNKFGNCTTIHQGKNIRAVCRKQTA